MFLNEFIKYVLLVNGFRVHCLFWFIWKYVSNKKTTDSELKVSRKSVFPVIWWATGKEKPVRFLETVILCEAFCENFKRKLGSILCYHTISVRTSFCVCICLIFQFVYLAYYCFCAMLFSVSHLMSLWASFAACVICLGST